MARLSLQAVLVAVACIGYHEVRDSHGFRDNAA